MTPDLKELMAKRPKNQSIKQQWRLPIHQIKETIFEYKDKNKYSQSVFAKSGGLFKKSISFFKNFLIFCDLKRLIKNYASV